MPWLLRWNDGSPLTVNFLCQECEKNGAFGTTLHRETYRLSIPTSLLFMFHYWKKKILSEENLNKWNCEVRVKTHQFGHMHINIPQWPKYEQNSTVFPFSWHCEFSATTSVTILFNGSWRQQVQLSGCQQHQWKWRRFFFKPNETNSNSEWMHAGCEFFSFQSFHDPKLKVFLTLIALSFIETHHVARFDSNSWGFWDRG